MHSFRSVLIEIRRSRIEGVGVAAVVELRKGERVAAGIGDADYKSLISWNKFSELDRDVQTKVDAFCIGTPDGFIPPDDLDFNRLSIEWYFNHSCEGNLGFDENGDFVVRRNVRKGEELTYDYSLAESNPKFRMDCKCGANDCRKIITGNDWRDPVFRKANIDYMLPRLRLPVKLPSAVSKPRLRTASTGMSTNRLSQRR
jgi:hypothetical protein